VKYIGIYAALIGLAMLTDCGSPASEPPPPASSGTGGSATGGRSGTGGTTVPDASGGSSGSGGAGTGTGGSATGGSAAGGTGAGGSSAPDAPAEVADAPLPTPSDASFRPIIPDAQPWQMMCPPGASAADCCGLYCQCMEKFCPKTLPTGCQDACLAGKTWDLTCRTYQCFASQNPNFPQDHDSHCQHAIGKLGKCGNR
jgi:hypothetical protein